MATFSRSISGPSPSPQWPGAIKRARSHGMTEKDRNERTEPMKLTEKMLLDGYECPSATVEALLQSVREERCLDVSC